jgi:hypothetical protein
MKTWWAILLALYLVIVGILTLTNVTIVAASIVQGVLAIAAAVCLLLGK